MTRKPNEATRRIEERKGGKKEKKRVHQL